MWYKYLVVKVFALFVFSTQVVIAQLSVPLATELDARRLSVSVSKTSNLIFPAAIKGVDRGSSSIVAQIATGGENILQLKAAKESFPQTNLSVITADGKFYSFLVDYSVEPKPLNLILAGDSIEYQKRAIASNVPFDKGQAKKVGKTVALQEAFMHRSSSNQKMQVTVTGLYLTDQLSWIALKATNRSLIPYEIEPIVVTVKDRIAGKREAIQELALPVIYQSKMNVLPGKGSDTIVIALHQFTLPTNKYLNIRMSEKNGGRIIDLKVRHGQIVRARLIRKQ
jgi:conjugative transposon TraN protein